MDANLSQTEEVLTVGQLFGQLGEDYEQTQKELKEIEVLIRQSSAEVEKLAQRNAQLANKLRQMEANLDTTPRQDIKEIYTAAQESQMRLFMMRGQVEQLQGKQQYLERLADTLRQEHVVYPRAVRWFLEGKLVIRDGVVNVKGNDAQLVYSDRD
ncbi:MAG: hypothetical protein P8186_11640 [Anaerolineae bacterium]